MLLHAFLEIESTGNRHRDDRRHLATVKLLQSRIIGGCRILNTVNPYDKENGDCVVPFFGYCVSKTRIRAGTADYERRYAKNGVRRYFSLSLVTTDDGPAPFGTFAGKSAGRKYRYELVVCGHSYSAQGDAKRLQKVA